MPQFSWLKDNSAFKHVTFRYYLISRSSIVCAQQVIGVAVGWQVYDQTGDAFALGVIGLLQFFPAMALFLITGSVADQYSRKAIVVASCLLGVVCSTALIITTYQAALSLAAVYAIVFFLGIQRAFQNPAIQSQISDVVPAEDLPGAIALVVSFNKMMQICGPVIGGLLYSFAPMSPYLIAVVLFLGSAVSIARTGDTSQAVRKVEKSWKSLTAGVRFILRQRVIFGAVSLDLFTVLLGGTITFLPIFAKDVLNLGPSALGLLRAAPAGGAILVALYLAVYPIKANAGRMMFGAVSIFGCATVVFGYSESPWLSIAALAVIGATDMISVVVRQTLVQVWTPAELRGRVNSVNQVFLGASNELGAFRAGAMAASMGAVPAVILGGVGTLCVAALWLIMFPALRKIDRLDRPARADDHA